MIKSDHVNKNWYKKCFTDYPDKKHTCVDPKKEMERQITKRIEEILEQDPDGKSFNTPGAKADLGKTRVWLCLAGFSRALEKVAEVTTVGANKYTPNGWSEVSNGYERYMDAFGRHFLEYAQGKKIDSGENGTGCEHIAQMIWNLLAAYELELRARK